MLVTIQEVFELHGFSGIETRAVEPLEQLLRKGETSKEVYVLQRLQAADDAPQAAADKALGLHFDLTVPFARYVLEHSGRLNFPFKRYQIQKVWRGERPKTADSVSFTKPTLTSSGKENCLTTTKWNFHS